MGKATQLGGFSSLEAGLGGEACGLPRLHAGTLGLTSGEAGPVI